MSRLLRELSDDEDAQIVSTPSTPSDPVNPWRKEFNQYLNVQDDLSEGQTIVQWWGVRPHSLSTFC
jgi:hypothetical protein